MSDHINTKGLFSLCSMVGCGYFSMDLNHGVIQEPLKESNNMQTGRTTKHKYRSCQTTYLKLSVYSFDGHGEIRTLTHTLIITSYVQIIHIPHTDIVLFLQNWQQKTKPQTGENCWVFTKKPRSQNFKPFHNQQTNTILKII